MPTGVALPDARAQLFAAVERVLVRDGAGGLTSRSVTEEAGVAKGVLYRHFADFDDFLAGLVRSRVAQVEADLGALTDDTGPDAGPATLVDGLSEALTRIFTPVNLRLVSVVIARDDLRARLRAAGTPGIPLLTEAGTSLRAYLEAEQRRGRITAGADVATLALTLIGTGHLLFAGEIGAPPDAAALREVVEAITAGVEPGVGP
ncbi:TetR/AcrR family transcriptional regulator [Promicromonospora sp. NPDC019610]|uniref:TetR/AcrR family transcriptional regulator n=1 Tax=Promicromonospora sp. NPDC019610 TaxID=3364405 RepID=UPI0037994A3C